MRESTCRSVNALWRKTRKRLLKCPRTTGRFSARNPGECENRLCGPPPAPREDPRSANRTPGSSAGAPRSSFHRRGVRRTVTPRMRAPFQEGDFPGRSSTATSRSAGSCRSASAVRARKFPTCRPDSLLPLPASEPLRRPGRGRGPDPERCRTGWPGPCWPDRWRPAVNAVWAPGPRLGDRITVSGRHGRLLRRPHPHADPRHQGPAGSTVPRKADVARRPRRRVRGTGERRGRPRPWPSTPAPPRRRPCAASTSLTTDGTVVELELYGDTSPPLPSASLSTPADDPGSQAASSPSASATTAASPTRSGSPASTRRKTRRRRADHRRGRVRQAPRTHADSPPVKPGALPPCGH